MEIAAVADRSGKVARTPRARQAGLPDRHPQGPFAFHTRAVLAKIALCRSGAYGYAKVACGECGHEEWRPRGCGLRHCPGCGQTRAESWIEERKLDTLDCPYFQLVFSLPPALYPLAQANPAQVYNLFFTAVRETLVELAQDPAHLGGLPQALLALHTWNGRLETFVHLHAFTARAAPTAPTTPRPGQAPPPTA